MAMLDVGCGYGLFTIPAARLVESRPVVGLDIDAEVLEQGRSLASGLTNPHPSRWCSSTAPCTASKTRSAWCARCMPCWPRGAASRW
ncbi:class I SAM-dependent methyltransferase [Synechococcus sp. FACHB-909]|uniref:class I SAM-dependent methyltransferase n=1 Tax=Synechococcus sp. FACHB-909 TaxID=2692863 RepID=UPI00336A2F07